MNDPSQYPEYSIDDILKLGDEMHGMHDLSATMQRRHSNAGQKSPDWYYKLKQLLGEGSFAQVWRAQDQIAKRKMAVKMYKLRSLQQPHVRMLVAQEIGVMKRLDHVNVIKLYDVHRTHRGVHLVMEYATGGSLFAFVRKHKTLKPDVCRPLYRQIVRAVAHMHSVDAVHRDIKLENVLFGDDGYLKLADFGLGVALDKPAQRLKDMAPEILANKRYSGQAVDVWALGVMLYLMLSGHFPFWGNSEADVRRFIAKAKPKWHDTIPSEARDLIARMLVADPGKRCSAQDILTSSWLMNPTTPRVPGQAGPGKLDGKRINKSKPASADAAAGSHRSGRNAEARHAQPRKSEPVVPSSMRGRHKSKASGGGRARASRKSAAEVGAPVESSSSSAAARGHKNQQPPRRNRRASLPSRPSTVYSLEFSEDDGDGDSAILPRRPRRSSVGGGSVSTDDDLSKPRPRSATPQSVASSVHGSVTRPPSPLVVPDDPPPPRGGPMQAFVASSSSSSSAKQASSNNKSSSRRRPPNLRGAVAAESGVGIRRPGVAGRRSSVDRGTGGDDSPSASSGGRSPVALHNRDSNKHKHQHKRRLPRHSAPAVGGGAGSGAGAAAHGRRHHRHHHHHHHHHHHRHRPHQSKRGGGGGGGSSGFSSGADSDAGMPAVKPVPDIKSRPNVRRLARDAVGRGNDSPSASSVASNDSGRRRPRLSRKAALPAAARGGGRRKQKEAVPEVASPASSAGHGRQRSAAQVVPAPRVPVLRALGGDKAALSPDARSPRPMAVAPPPAAVDTKGSSSSGGRNNSRRRARARTPEDNSRLFVVGPQVMASLSPTREGAGTSGVDDPPARFLGGPRHRRKRMPAPAPALAGSVAEPASDGSPRGSAGSGKRSSRRKEKRGQARLDRMLANVQSDDLIRDVDAFLSGFDSSVTSSKASSRTSSRRRLKASGSSSSLGSTESASRARHRTAVERWGVDGGVGGGSPLGGGLAPGTGSGSGSPARRRRAPPQDLGAATGGGGAMKSGKSSESLHRIDTLDQGLFGKLQADVEEEEEKKNVRRAGSGSGRSW